VAQPAFRLTAANAPAVAAICAQLDGIPLALELAAARVRTLTVEAIAARLSDRFKLLVSQDRTVLPRQRTLRALIDWSYDLLGETEKALFARLSVFAGGWTLEAAEAVGQGGDIASEDVLDLLARLVEKSLVRMDADSGRYGMLETVKAYAREKLEASDDIEPTLERHLDFFLGLAEVARVQLVGPEQSAWMSRVDADLENLFAVHVSARIRPNWAKRDLSIVRGIQPYWVARGMLELGAKITLEALANPGAQEDSFERAVGLFTAGMLLYFMERHSQSRDLLTESTKVSKRIGDERVLAAALPYLSIASQSVGQGEEAIAHCDEAAHLAAKSGNPHSFAAARNTKGQILRYLRRRSEARAEFEAAGKICEEIGDAQANAVTGINLAMLDLEEGDTSGAKRRLRNISGPILALNSPVMSQSLFDVCAGLAAAQQMNDEALKLNSAADRLVEETANRRIAVDARFVESTLEKIRNAYGNEGGQTAREWPPLSVEAATALIDRLLA